VEVGLAICFSIRTFISARTNQNERKFNVFKPKLKFTGRIGVGASDEITIARNQILKATAFSK